MIETVYQPIGSVITLCYSATLRIFVNNLVGKDIVNFALNLGILNKDSILKVRGVPHAQIIKI